jgi:Cytochrome c oxidase subunit IV
MSPLERPVPPAGEEIHLPGGSIQPLLMAVFITIALVGVTVNWWMTIAGGIGIVAVLIRWIVDTRRDIGELPLHHDGH